MSAEINAKERLVFLDHAKFIGILLVVYAHIVRLDSNVSGLHKSIADVIYQFHMPLFFIISGFVLAVTSKRSSNTKLLLSYILWSIIYIGLQLIDKGFNNGDVLYSLKERSYAFLSLRGIAPIWFLGALYLSKLFFELIAKGYNKEKKINVSIIIMLVLSIASNVLFTKLSITRKLIKYPLIAVFRFFLATFFLLTGYKLGKARHLIEKYKVAVIALCGIIFAVVCIFYDNNVNMHLFRFDSVTLFIVSGIAGSMVLITLCMYMPTGFFTAKLGKASMDIMVLHYPPVPLYDTVIKSLAFVGLYMPVLAAVLLLVFCYLIHLFIFEPLRRRG